MGSGSNMKKVLEVLGKEEVVSKLRKLKEILTPSGIALLMLYP